MASNKWDGVSDQYAIATAATFAKCANQMLSLVSFEAGQKLAVLDLATGPGPTVYAALERYPGSSVTAVDSSAGMLDQLAKRFNSTSCAVTGKVASMADVSKLFEEDSFDLTACQFGIDFLSAEERPGFWAGIRKVLRGGQGQVVVSAWNEKSFVKLFKAAVKRVEGVVCSHIDRSVMHTLLAKKPSAMKVPENMAAEMVRAGFTAVKVRVLKTTFDAVSAESLWESLSRFSPTVKGAVAKLGKERASAVRAEFIKSVAQFADESGAVALPCTFNVGHGLKGA